MTKAGSTFITKRTAWMLFLAGCAFGAVWFGWAITIALEEILTALVTGWRSF